MQIPGDAPIDGGDEHYMCDDGSNLVSVKFDDSQVQALKNKAATGELNFAESKIDVEGVMINKDNIAWFAPGKQIAAIARDKKGLWDQRNLQGTGDKYFILFRVTDANGLVYGHSASVMSDNMFGTDNDSVNLKSQMAACSVGKYNIIPGGKPGWDTSGIEAAPGVIEITIQIDITVSSRNDVKNAARTAARERLRVHFGESTLRNENYYMDHAQYSLQKCYLECGWAAYASAPGYYQFYQAQYYYYAGVQVHEHGHK